MKLIIRMYGAGWEVGRSCIELEFPDGTRILLDAGLKILQDRVEYPIVPEDLSKIDLAFVSHSHLDHVGAYPLFCMLGLNCPIICTNLTREVSEVLLEDSHKINKSKKESQEIGIGYMARAINLMEPSLKGNVGKVSYKLIPSGHIPGASCVYFEYEGKSILYTSDINSEDTLLMNGVGQIPLADIVIIDGTYGDREHKPRAKMIEKYKETVINTINRGGSVLNGVFAVARAQEVLLVYNDIDIVCPIYFDGMGNKVLDIYLKYQNLMNGDGLVKINDRIIRVDSNSDRVAATEQQGIYIATSGMYNVGPVLTYLQAIADDPLSTIIISGFQADGTGGSQLLADSSIEIGGKRLQVLCEIADIKMSTHDDIIRLEKIINKTNPRFVVAQHADRAGIKSLVRLVEKQNRIAFAPRNGEELIINL